MKKRIITCLLSAAVATCAMAQGGTSSPYSQFGFGQLADQSQGVSRGMNGVGIALRNNTQINTLNPASYSGVDSLTMLFEAGVVGQLSQFKEGDVKLNNSTANIDYVVGSFRAFRNLGVGFGVLPFTNVGYEFSALPYRDSENGTITSTYTGTGGLHQAFLGLGWRPLRPLSVGVNMSYLWGDYEKSVSVAGTSNLKSEMRTYSASIQSYKLDLGVQWEQKVSKNDVLTLGATVGLGHKLGADALCTNLNVSDNKSVSDTVKNAFELPLSVGAGISYNHQQKLLIAADVRLQQWGKTSFPAFVNGKYVSSDDVLRNSMQTAVGLDWLPTTDPYNRRLLSHMHYRIGVGYATPYYKVNGVDGPKEYSASIGIGMPLGRSTLNLSGQWIRRSVKDMITDNSFRVSLSFTFSERWFAKLKVD